MRKFSKQESTSFLTKPSMVITPVTLEDTCLGQECLSCPITESACAHEEMLGQEDAPR